MWKNAGLSMKPVSSLVMLSNSMDSSHREVIAWWWFALLSALTVFDVLGVILLVIPSALVFTVAGVGLASGVLARKASSVHRFYLEVIAWWCLAVLSGLAVSNVLNGVLPPSTSCLVFIVAGGGLVSGLLARKGGMFAGLVVGGVEVIFLHLVIIEGYQAALRVGFVEAFSMYTARTHSGRWWLDIVLLGVSASMGLLGQWIRGQESYLSKIGCH